MLGVAFDVSNLYKRFTALEQEVAYTQRKRREEGEQAVAALQAIPAERVDELREYVPDIVFLRQCTVDDFIENKNGELARLQKMYNDLTYLADSWLKHFEDSL